MAKGKGEIKGWITKNGVHIPIYGTYTVRGGVEPKAKGAKWSKKKKRPDDLRAKDINGKERLINRKDLEDALAEVKSKAKNATNENEWRQYENEAKDIQKALDGKEVSPLVANNYGKLSAKKKPSMSEEDKTVRTVADHYGVSHEEAKEGIKSGKYTEDNIKEAKDYKATMKNLEDKRDAGSIAAEDYESTRREAIKGFNESRKAKTEGKKERNVLGQEVDFAEVDRTAKEREKDFIVNTPIPEGKAWERAESKRKAMEAADEADAYDRQHKEGKYADRDFSSDLANAHKAGYSEQQESPRTAANGAPRVSDEDAGHNKEIEWNGGKYQTQQVRDWDSDKKQEYVAGHLYVPIDPKNGEKQFFVANEDGSVHSSGTDYLNKKSQGSSSSSFSPESSAKAINDMARRRANGGGKDDDWKIANQTLESAPAGTTMIQTGDRGVKFQYTKGEDGKWHSSAGEDYTQDSKTLSMSWRHSSPSVEFTTPDKVLSNEDIKASHTAATSGRLNQALGLDRNNRPIGNRSTPKVDTSTSNSNITDTLNSLSVEGGKERARIDLGKVDSKTISQMKQKIYKAGDKAGVAYGVQVGNTTEKTPDGGYKTIGTSISVLRLDKTGVKKQSQKSSTGKKDSLSEGMAKRREIRAQISDTNKAKDGNFSDMTVSGLKQALAGARPGDKTKIRAELRKRGYSYVGGRWIKA